jgi:hypothetical protein
MLDSAIASPTFRNQELMTLWAARYLPDLSAIPFYVRKLVFNSLAAAISSPNRKKLADSILTNLVTDCAFAGIEAQKLCLKAGEGLKIAEAKDLGNHIAEIYRKLLDLYVEDFIFAPVLDSLYELDTPAGRIQAATRVMPGFTRLSQTLQPLLQHLQSIYVSSDNPRAIGFLTTQLHLTRHNILTRLDAYGRMWLSSYLQLIEEQVCMPWQRIAQAASQAGHPASTLTMVQQMLPLTQPIAEKVYQLAVLEFPHHISRQGRIQTMAVQTSSTRDLNMFQSYIWLCVLEGNISVVQQELIPLCLLVFPALEVKWTFVEQGISWLRREIQPHLDREQLTLFDPIIVQIQQAFATANPHQVNESDLRQQMRQRVAFTAP